MEITKERQERRSQFINPFKHGSPFFFSFFFPPFFPFFLFLSLFSFSPSLPSIRPSFLPSSLFFPSFFPLLFRAAPAAYGVSRLGVRSKLQLPAYAMATAMPDPSCVFDLHHSSQQCQILNPLRETRGRTCVLMDASWICFHWATTRTLKLIFIFWNI